MKRNKIRNLKKDEPKKFDISTTKKPWKVTLNGKPLSRNSIYIGDTLPDFLLQNYQRQIYKLSRPDGTVVDENIRQKVKKTIVKKLLRLNYKYEPRNRFVEDATKIIDDVSVRIKWIHRKGYVVVIDHRKSSDIDKDTLKVRAFLEKKGIAIKDESICPTYCIFKREIAKEDI